jgi:hypothetical protein
MPQRQAAARRVAIEIATLLQDLEELDGGAPRRVEQVRFDETDLRELTNP